MKCPYCNKPLDQHRSITLNFQIMYECPMMPRDGRIWCIPHEGDWNKPTKMGISINPKFTGS